MSQRLHTHTHGSIVVDFKALTGQPWAMPLVCLCSKKQAVFSPKKKFPIGLKKKPLDIILCFLPLEREKKARSKKQWIINVSLLFEAYLGCVAATYHGLNLHMADQQENNEPGSDHHLVPRTNSFNKDIRVINELIEDLGKLDVKGLGKPQLLVDSANISKSSMTVSGPPCKNPTTNNMANSLSNLSTRIMDSDVQGVSFNRKRINSLDSSTTSSKSLSGTVETPGFTEQVLHDKFFNPATTKICTFYHAVIWMQSNVGRQMSFLMLIFKKKWGIFFFRHPTQFFPPATLCLRAILWGEKFIRF